MGVHLNVGTMSTLGDMSRCIRILRIRFPANGAIVIFVRFWLQNFSDSVVHLPIDLALLQLHRHCWLWG